MRHIKKKPNTRHVLYYPIPILQTIFLGVVSIAQLVEVMVSVVLGGVVEVVSLDLLRA